MDELRGRCLCGGVTWVAAGSVLWAGHCHCESCRRASSSPVTSFFGVRREGVAWAGAVARLSSSHGVERGFCPSCGAQMFYQSARWPEETHLYAASLDDPAAFRPEAHYHWAERVPWLSVSDDLPKFDASAVG